MADKAKVRFDISTPVFEMSRVNVSLTCGCGVHIGIHTGLDMRHHISRNNTKEGSFIIECPNPECRRRYEVGLVEVEAM